MQDYADQGSMAGLKHGYFVDCLSIKKMVLIFRTNYILFIYDFITA